MECCCNVFRSVLFYTVLLYIYIFICLFSATTDVDVIKVFAIIVSLVLMPGLLIIICVVSQCPLRSRMFRRHRRSRERLEQSQLRPDSQVSEVRIVQLMFIVYYCHFIAFIKICFKRVIAHLPLIGVDKFNSQVGQLRWS